MLEVAAALLSVILVAASQLLFKVAGARRKLISAPVAAGLALNLIAAACWVFALRRLDLSYAFPLLCLNYLLVPLAARQLLGERLSTRRLSAIAVIVAGVCLCAIP